MGQWGKIRFSISFVLVALLFSVPGLCGSLDDPAAPTSGTSAMYTIGDVYNRVNTGTSSTKRSGAFREPSAGPGSTGYTLTELYDLASQRSRPRTSGQTVCYDGSGAVIPCSGTGQDGELQKGVTRPIPRFSDNGNGTVTDNLSGLIWLKNANCDGVKTWTSALTWANGLYDGCASCGGANNDCGLSDGSTAGVWRLPNKDELASLTDYRFYSPSLSNAQGTAKWTEGDVFSGVQLYKYWSSTTCANNTSNAWRVDFDDGDVNVDSAKTHTDSVWPVRGGQ